MMKKMKEACPMMTEEMMKGGMMQGKNATPETSGEEAAATLTADSVQVIQITVGPEGFDPAKLTLEAGVPARLVFTRTSDGTCAKQVQIPAFEIEKTDLPLGEPVAIEFTPTEAGTFTFACGMDMLKGAIVVKRCRTIASGRLQHGFRA